VAPLRIAEPLDVTVVDAESGAPIPGATTLYFVCDIHDFDFSAARFERRTSNEKGKVKIHGHRKWGVWFPAPGGLPVPNHFIAIWAPGYSAFVFSQYDETVEDLKTRIHRQEFEKRSPRFRAIAHPVMPRSIRGKS
jgi:hypothetical protein